MCGPGTGPKNSKIKNNKKLLIIFKINCRQTLKNLIIKKVKYIYYISNKKQMVYGVARKDMGNTTHEGRKWI